MTTAFDHMTVQQLVDQFVELTLGQHQADIDSDSGRYNRLYRRMRTVENELKSRAGDQRRELSSLYNHPNAQVRLMSAIATLAINSQAARKVLQIISDRNEYPQAANARQMMEALDDGSYIPS